MNTSVPLSKYIQVINLPRLSQSNKTFVGSVGQVVGFGLTKSGGSNQLNSINVTVISNSQCSNIYGSAFITPNVMCSLGAKSKIQTVCYGDLGNGLALNQNGTWTQIGVVSFMSARGCTFDDPVGYTRTSKKLQWIQALTGISIRQ